MFHVFLCVVSLSISAELASASPQSSDCIFGLTHFCLCWPSLVSRSSECQLRDSVATGLSEIIRNQIPPLFGIFKRTASRTARIRMALYAVRQNGHFIYPATTAGKQVHGLFMEFALCRRVRFTDESTKAVLLHKYSANSSEDCWESTKCFYNRVCQLEDFG